jgi:hypothetical protein
MERISPWPLQLEVELALSTIPTGLMAFAPLQPTPLAGPRHTRQVPINNCV